MAVGRSASTKLDWTRLSSQLSLKGSTATSLQSFKKRNDDARRKLQLLQQSPQPEHIDFASYRAQLKNQAVVDEIEGKVKTFLQSGIKKYDVDRQLKAIEGFEKVAVQGAQETKGAVEKELADLEKTLKNIEEARPFEDLTIDEIAAARPDIDKRTEQLVSKGRWNVPGYHEKFGNMSVL